MVRTQPRRPGRKGQKEDMAQRPPGAIAARIARLRQRSRETRRTSQLLAALLEDAERDRISLADIFDGLGDRAYGGLMIVFAVPNLVPVAIPGLSAVLGIPLILLTAQLCWGWPRPWLPRWLAQRSFARADLARVLDRALPYLARLERLCKPRLAILSEEATERVIGAVCLGLSVILALPIPFVNFLPGLAICLLGFALVERDGLVGLMGMAVGAVSAVLAVGVLWAMLKAAILLVTQLFA